MASAETQTQSSGESGFYAPTGSGSGSGGTVTATGGEPVITADDLTKQPATSVAEQPLTLSEQIAANFAALSGILGSTDQTGGGAYPVPVPVATPAKSSSLIWVIMIGAAVAVYFIFFRKKGAQNGE